MLISFKFSNWMSFYDETTLNMTATQVRQHKDRLPKLPSKYGFNVLPTSVIYGGNASGKTNLYKAFSFARNIVVTGTDAEECIEVKPFRLMPRGAEEPTSMEFILFIDDTIYEYRFEVTQDTILGERLIQINASSEKKLFERVKDQYYFDPKIESNVLDYLSKATRKNQLFITNSVDQNNGTFKNIYDWFKYNLILISPNSRYSYFGSEELSSKVNTLLGALGTGVCKLAEEEVGIEDLRIPENILKDIKSEVKKSGKTMMLRNLHGSKDCLISWSNNNWKAKHLVTYHQDIDGNEIKFGLELESDGTRRLIDLLPAFLDVSKVDTDGKTCIIDEVDRSLHSLMTKKLLETYLNSCHGDTRSQLIMTTHDVTLMDQSLLRRDELWITDKNSAGMSTIYSLSDFKGVRADKDICKSYLLGRYGGIPDIDDPQELISAFKE